MYLTVVEKSIFVTATGEPVPSFPPWTASNKKKMVALLYLVYYTLIVDNLDETVHMLSDTLLMMSEGSVMEIKL
jgi:hypothetical protein